MKLKGRLKIIADRVPVSHIACDIGTDHAFVPIYLVEKQRCKKVIACDVRKGPLQAAKKNVHKFGYEASIELRLGDGLAPVGEGEVDTIIIAGMGGMLMTEILEAGINKARKASCLILQPMYAIELVREWLYKNGFDIRDESLAAEGHKIYNVIVASWTGEHKDSNSIDYYVGRKLIEKEDPLLKSYIENKIQTLGRIIEELGNSKHTQEEIENNKNLMTQLEQVLEVL